MGNFKISEGLGVVLLRHKEVDCLLWQIQSTKFDGNTGPLRLTPVTALFPKLNGVGTFCAGY